MRRRSALRVASSLAFAGLLAGCGRGESAAADMVFLGGRVFTADEAVPEAEGVAVRGGLIVFVGTERGARDFIGAGTEVVELGGRMLLPAFQDTHVHPVSGGVELGDCDLNPAASREDVVRIVSACAAREPRAAWVRGGGFELPLFPDGAPSRELLDSLVPDRPAYLTSLDAHTAWVNSKALALAGVGPETEAPTADGVIVRDSQGRPQGTLRESAMELVARHVPEHSDAELDAGLARALAMAASFGVTTLGEANATEAYLRAYASAEAAGTLTARVVAAIAVDLDAGPADTVRLSALRERYSSDLLLPVAAKIFLDGVIEGGTAALLEPYLDRPGWRGELRIAPARLDTLVAALDEAGFKIHIHAIGDRAIKTALDALEGQHERDGGRGPRHVLAHLQLFDSADLPRFSRLGVVASFQPLWAYEDTYITDLTAPRLGPERMRWNYPIRSLVETGAIVAAGSDWSVSSMDPLRAIEVGVTRRDPDLDIGRGWIPEERASLRDMLLAYTIQAARAGDVERIAGSITVGKSADLVVLDQDLFIVPEERISDTRVDLTLFRGRVVYRRSLRGAARTGRLP